MPHTEFQTPAERHHNIVLSMSVMRGALLSALLGPTETLAPHLEEAIELAAQDLDLALYNLADGGDIAANRTRYRHHRAALEGALTAAGMTTWALNALRAMLGDYLREAEHLATLAVVA